MLDKLDLQLFSLEASEVDDMVNEIDYAQEIERKEAYWDDPTALAQEGSEFQGANIKTGLAAMTAVLSKIEDRLQRIADSTEAIDRYFKALTDADELMKTLQKTGEQ